ncbi:hypothetical protein K2173_017745 [Erythroxylum novogranatense]|uniref:Peptide-N(4)-(N-acetyl-beta-glucosaminyl)asparagine amidase n=1 Tax=Erythroxylum novogranatense TaxID=1862640 RepID=A0AAV8T1R3_9ROSI|nr:hypothetical protein K2173_017745 [Erythroxylum novogranatense]
MVCRKVHVSHRNSTFDVDYDSDDGFEVFKFQLFSLTSLPPDQQKILQEDDDKPVLDGSDFTDRIKLLSVNDEGECSEDFLKSDEEFARMLQAEEEALMLQEFAVQGQSEPFEARIRPYVTQVLMYEDPVRQEAARKTVPIEELEEKALVSLAKEGNLKPTKKEQDHAFLLQLLSWFKQSFRWVNAPSCDVCGNDTVRQGMGDALTSETQYGATRVELYHCNSCTRITRFPRYNDPLKLVETRRGRCGEWANCFTLYCHAFGYESRLILDFTDHVWTECFSPMLGRWVHLDPCDGIYDKPLLYEKGWGKKLNYVIAIAKDGVYDVTKRYTRNWPEVLSRRNITTEPALSAAIANFTKECRRGFASHMLSVLEDRDRTESEELERDVHSTYDTSVTLPGRQSGDKEWRISRSEIGSGESCSLSCSSCPVRTCIDEHVTRICNAFIPLFSQFVENSLSKARVIQILKEFKGILVDLTNSSYKMRRTSINPFMLLFLPYFGELLNALSLKNEIDSNGKVDICLAGDPIKTSLALPVMLDTLDDVIDNLDKCVNFGKYSLPLPLLKNRIHSGSVVASGEDLPFGIGTSAFDGLRSSKWEEANGARGSWILYRLSDNRMHELVAYGLVSANDAPERDPMDWVVEGSDDGGLNWHVLDKQTSQVFEKRYQRRTFEVESKGLLCNAFRFRFLSVKDVQSTSRLQLSGIDLYSSGI